MRKLFRRRPRPGRPPATDARSAYARTDYPLTCPICDRIEKHTLIGPATSALTYKLQATSPLLAGTEELPAQASPYLIEEPP